MSINTFQRSDIKWKKRRRSTRLPTCCRQMAVRGTENRRYIRNRKTRDSSRVDRCCSSLQRIESLSHPSIHETLPVNAITDLRQKWISDCWVYLIQSDCGMSRTSWRIVIKWIKTRRSIFRRWLSIVALSLRDLLCRLRYTSHHANIQDMGRGKELKKTSILYCFDYICIESLAYKIPQSSSRVAAENR